MMGCCPSEPKKRYNPAGVTGYSGGEGAAGEGAAGQTTVEAAGEGAALEGSARERVVVGLSPGPPIGPGVTSQTGKTLS